MSAEEASRIAQAVQRMRNSKRALQIALPTAAALGAGAAVAVGSVVGGDGTITGCYANPTPNVDGFRGNITINGATEPPGALRVIDPTATAPQGVPDVADECQKEETPITWNQKGPAGPQGPAGSPGPAGSQGATGSPLIGGTTFGISGNGRYFLKLDGIKGESTDKMHKGEIEIASFSFGAQGGAFASGGGGGAGKVSFQSFTITKTLDKSSPLLFQAAASGKHIKEAVLSFARKAGSKEQTYLKFDFQEVLISGVQDGGSSGKIAPTEQVTLNFQKCKETFLDSKGKVGQTVSINVGNTLKL